jgi:hypothetical protein
MILPRPKPAFDHAIQLETNRLIEAADAETWKRGSDIEMAAARLILTSPDGTRYALAVADGGALETIAI